MKLYDFKMAPNPQRVNMFLAEKGVEIPIVEINTRERAQFDESFKAVKSAASLERWGVCLNHVGLDPDDVADDQELIGSRDGLIEGLRQRTAVGVVHVQQRGRHLHSGGAPLASWAQASRTNCSPKTAARDGR